MSSPPRSGMLMSRINRSKRPPRSMSSVCMPLEASAMEANFASSCRNWRRPARTSAWSSAIRIRVIWSASCNTSARDHLSRADYCLSEQTRRNTFRAESRVGSFLQSLPMQRLRFGVTGGDTASTTAMQSCAPRLVLCMVGKRAATQHLAPAPRCRMRIERHLQGSEYGHGQKGATYAPGRGADKYACNHDQRIQQQAPPQQLRRDELRFQNVQHQEHCRRHQHRG